MQSQLPSSHPSFLLFTFAGGVFGQSLGEWFCTVEPLQLQSPPPVGRVHPHAIGSELWRDGGLCFLTTIVRQLEDLSDIIRQAGLFLVVVIKVSF